MTVDWCKTQVPEQSIIVTRFRWVNYIIVIVPWFFWFLLEPDVRDIEFLLTLERRREFVVDFKLCWFTGEDNKFGVSSKSLINKLIEIVTFSLHSVLFTSCTENTYNVHFNKKKRDCLILGLRGLPFTTLQPYYR